jgi:hypothetical protein
MSKKKSFSYGETFNEWEQIKKAFTDNQSDFPHLESHRAQLEALLEEAREMAQQQAVHTASRQDTSRRLEAAVERGRKLASFMRAGAKERYGNRSEKLVEFGVQPLRTRRPAKKSPEPPPGPEVTAPDPDSQR